MTNYTVDLCGEIDDALAHRVCGQLRELSKHSEEIVLYIDSPGGFSNAMQEIATTIKQLGVPTWGYVIGVAESAAFNVLQFCERRFASQHASLLFHRGRYTPGNNPEFAKLFWGEPYVLAPITEFDYELYKMMAKRSGLAISQIENFAHEELYVSAHEALGMGLIDAIL